MLNNKDCKFKEKCGHFKSSQFCQQTDEMCPRYFKLYHLCKNAQLSENQCNQFMCHNYSIDNKIDNEKYHELLDYEEHIKEHVLNGDSLYIYSSNVGNGKTSWAIRLMIAYFSSIWRRADPEHTYGLFLSVPKFLIELKNSFNQQNDYIDTVKEALYDADVVVWDEIASKCGSEFDKETLLNIINDRINSGKCNIYTSNADKNELYKLLDSRLTSRVFEMSQQIEFKGSDKRGVQK